MRKYTILIALLAFAMQVNAQRTSLGFFMGGALYKGDLSSTDLFSTEGLNGAIGVQWEYQVSPTVFISGNLSAGKVSGNDAIYENRQQWPRLMNFSSILTEATLNFEWHLFGEESPNKKADQIFTNRISPYIYTGIGVVNVDASIRGLPSDAQEVLDGTDNGTYLSIPLGIGFKFNVNNTWSIDFEGGFRFPTTDLIDGISTSRNPDFNDTYSIMGVSLNYRLGMNKKEKNQEE